MACPLCLTDQDVQLLQHDGAPAPCGHALCADCHEQLMYPQCPFCRAPIDAPDAVHARALTALYGVQERDEILATYLQMHPGTPLDVLYTALEQCEAPVELLELEPDELEARYVKKN